MVSEGMTNLSAYNEQYAGKEALRAIEEYCEACEGLCNTPPEGQRPCDIYQLKQYILSRTHGNNRSEE